MSEEELARYGVGQDLVRVSVGIEDWRDLRSELQSALDAL
jgi:cystathionine beta-lyase/cystathionine gamma-synthase